MKYRIGTIVSLLLAAFLLGHGAWGSKRSKREVDVDQPGIDIKKNGTTPEKLLVTNQPDGGSTYVRWGRTVCQEESHIVYSGVAGGSWFDYTGGGGNYLCLTSQPIWGDYNDEVAGLSNVFGAEYQTGWPLQSDNIVGKSHYDHDVPCVVCLTSGRSTNVMIPGRNECLGEGWTLEYHGYLMSGYHAHKGRTEFLCMDAAPEADPAGYENKDGALFYYTEAACGSLPCPPYVNGREITCAVCSK